MKRRARATGAGALMELHLAALFVLDRRGRLVSVNATGAGRAPKFFLGRTADGIVWAVRQDVGAELEAGLRALAGSEAPGHPSGPLPRADEPYLELLARHVGVERAWTGPAYRFPASLSVDTGAVAVRAKNAHVLARYLDEWLPHAAAGVPMTAVLEAGAAVSVCGSVRMTAEAHEAGVETHRDFRGRGFGSRAVAAWARAVRRLGPMPLYSTSWANRPSRALADRLGLVQYGSVLHVT